MAAACLTVEWCVIEKTTAETTRMKQDCAVNTSVLQNFKYIKFTCCTPKIYTEISSWSWFPKLHCQNTGICRSYLFVVFPQIFRWTALLMTTTCVDTMHPDSSGAMEPPTPKPSPASLGLITPLVIIQVKTLADRLNDIILLILNIPVNISQILFNPSMQLSSKLVLSWF